VGQAGQGELKRMPRIAGISSMATRHVLAELADVYVRRGVEVAVESVGGVDAARRVKAGEPLDFAVLAASAIGDLEAEGHLLRGSRVDIATSAIALAVAAGARKPDIWSADAVRETVARAKRIGYSTGPSGTHLLRLFKEWGLGEAIEARLVKAPPGVPVAALLETGDVELGFQQLSELIHEPGVEVVGPLPPEIQALTTFSGAVCAASTQPDAVRAWLEFAASPDAEAAKRRNGMHPA
jgi:molybdate transport system substrate-binding protein